jgi:hypothetical protein
VIRQRADECNRIQKLLENCNIKLASVAPNVLGVSGRDMLRALTEGVDSPAVLVNLARGKLRDKIPEQEEALRGVMSDTQLWLLREQLHKVCESDEGIARLDVKVAALCLLFAQALALLGIVGGDVSGQPRERWQAAEGQDVQGGSLAAAVAGGGALGGVAYQRCEPERDD